MILHTCMKIHLQVVKTGWSVHWQRKKEHALAHEFIGNNLMMELVPFSLNCLVGEKNFVVQHMATCLA